MKSVLAMRIVAVLLVLTSVGGLRSEAQTAVSWTGTSNGNWNTASDWSGGGVPNNGGGKTYNVTINPSAAETVDLNLGVTVTDLTLGASATLQSTANDSLTLASGGTLTNNGTILFDATGGNIIVGSGGTLTNSGTLELSFAAAATTTLSVTGNVDNSGTFTTGFSGGANTVNVSGTFTNTATGSMSLYGPKDVWNINSLSNSGTLTIDTGAVVNITGGGEGITDIVAGSAITLAGALNVINSGVSTNGLAQLTTVAGSLYLNNNQTTSVTPSGGTLTIASGGYVLLSDGAATTTKLSVIGNVNNFGEFTTGFSGGTNSVDVSGTFTNNSGASLILSAVGGTGVVGTDLVDIPILSNAGTVELEEPGSTLDITGTGTLTNSGMIDLTQGALKFTSSTATLTGGGIVTLGNPTGTETGVIDVGPGDTGTLTNSNNTITGYGNLGNGTLTLVNKGTISANGEVSSGTLTIQPGSGALTNTGTLEAENQATLILKGTYKNSGGTIAALGESGGTVNPVVELTAGTVINGGTLTTTTVGTNGGIIEGTGAVTLNGVTNAGAYAVNAGTTTTLEGTIINSGSITLTGSTLSIGNSVTLKGTGTVTLSNTAANLITGATSGLTLTNASTIEGAGTISKLGIVNTGRIAATQSTPLIILPSSDGLNNQGTLSVSAGDTMEIGTSTGGALVNFSGTTLTGGTYSVSGTLEFGASGTSVVTDAANISLTGSAAKIVDFSGVDALTDLATITSAGSFTIGSGANFTTMGSFTNNGKLTVNTGSEFTVISTGSLTNFNSSTHTLTGGSYTIGGKLDFAGADIVTDAASITLDGTGEIVNSTSSANGLANLATITSVGSFTLGSKANFTTVGNLTNDGKLTVNSGSKLTVTGDLTNFNSATHTLASGTYTLGGTLEFTGADIVNNNANLTITGSAAKILNGTANGLANFANNTNSLTISGTGSFTTGAAAFTDSGKVTVAKGSSLTVGGGNTYTQSAGTTTVDGTLTASGTGITVTGGTILGAGELNSNVTVGGAGTAPTISVGDSGKAGLLAITGNYTQLSTATLNSFIGGTTVGMQYSQLQVSGTASLAGTLSVTLASGFTPTVGSTFTVLTASSVTGTFSNSTIAINGSEHFNVSYTSTGVVLTVASGLPRSSILAAVPAKKALSVTSGLRLGVAGTRPRSASFLVAGIGNARARAGAILAGGYGLGRLEGPNHLPVQLAVWEHMPSAASPAAQLPRSAENPSQRLPASSNWNAPARAISTLHMPPTETLMRRSPVRILPSNLPRLGR